MIRETSDVSSVEVNRASVADVATLAPLFDAYRQFYGAESNRGAATDFIAARLARSESVILIARRCGLHEPSTAECDQAALGFAQLYPSFSSVGMSRIFVLNDLYVASEWRTYGVGRRLIAEAARYATTAGATSLTISTQHTNERALGLYESCGFARDTHFTHLTLDLRSIGTESSPRVSHAVRAVSSTAHAMVGAVAVLADHHNQ